MAAVQKTKMKAGHRSVEATRSFILRDKQQAKPAVTAWLRETLVEAKGCSVAREELYHHYRLMCAASRIESTSPSGFGRLIKKVFPMIKSRRLGARTVNKMHYNNMRLVTSAHTTTTFRSDNSKDEDRAATTQTTSSEPTSPVVQPPSAPSSGCATPVGSHASTPPSTPGPSLSYGPLASSPSSASPPQPSYHNHHHYYPPQPLPELPSWPSALGLAQGPIEWEFPGKLEEEEFLPALHYGGCPAPNLSWTTVDGPVGGQIHHPPPHPWVTMPITALGDLATASSTTSSASPHGAALARAMESVMYQCNTGPIASLAPQLYKALHFNPYDDEIYRCIFVLAWWQRFLCGDRAEGNDHCRGMLEHMLSYPGSRASSIFAPAIELLQSCTSPESAMWSGVTPEVEQHLLSMLDQCQAQQACGVEPSVWMELQGCVAQAILCTHRALHSPRPEECVSWAVTLVQLLWAIESESVLALCFHELDSRGMLRAVLWVLPQGCQGQVHDGQLLRERLFRMTRRFPSVFSRLEIACK